MNNATTTDNEQWRKARLALLAREKAFTRERDALNAARRELPWLRIDTPYDFDTGNGIVSLDDLFDGHSQLVIYHFMFGPDWEEGCTSCSFWADNYDGIDVHLAARDIALVTVARAPIDALLAYKQRMGWTFRLVSSSNSAFNFDCGVSFTDEQRNADAPNYNFGASKFSHDEAPGISCFAKDADGRLYLTYATFSRGLDMANGAYHLMDLTSRGRDENELDWPQAWLRRRDSYQND